MSPSHEARVGFERYLRELTAAVEADPDLVGLVGLGSTAERHRVDEWSDHDFALVTRPGLQDRYRHDLSWLPRAQEMALSVVEHHGGVKVVYDDGHVLEFGIADPDGLRGWAGNATDVLVDRGGVAEAVADLLAKPLPEGAPDPRRDLLLLHTQVLIGVGRARRGELLNANVLIRVDALGRLLRVLAATRASGSPLLDSLDASRRVELVLPGLAAELDRALARPVEECARGLLDLAAREFGGDAIFPTRGAAAVRRRLGWT